jgi:hypothetical protein
MFEGHKKRRPAPTARERALQKKWEELARVRKRLHAGGLRAGLKAALEAQAAMILEEIDEVEGVINLDDEAYPVDLAAQECDIGLEASPYLRRRIK